MREVSMLKVLNDNSLDAARLTNGFTLQCLVSKARQLTESSYLEDFNLCWFSRKLEEAYLVESRATYGALKALLQHPASLQRDPRAAGEGCLTGVLPLHADEPIEESQRIFSAVIGYKQARGDADGDT
ncbi:hypothetical protein Pmar_PMAR025851 [Perkinsus marinus ATCC 50983]|uniref:Uncharacterized protein n=1 Tax=Perkinsus marinus (strain ATCC 50983 / TXsc) TaxID=423536 RepID=C5LUW3_PERM5|nr:hypothetical protein Pmar_PMAR025851 [Perkinsus marinus ATCC 50983]EEQ99463.1 hypothetical protein Pmar_PMAR025851 [Perkinsus marinus ATCC 50983]|eukprot:XP_002766746.1 hypothetical protein Pmar_PMAR025851 [Perkinsus marinus ATCC 50983]